MGDDVCTGLQNEENDIGSWNQLLLSDEKERRDDHANEEKCDKKRQEPEVRPEDHKADVLAYDPLVFFVIHVREQMIAEKKKGT